jgi:hypothetical protein
MEVDNTDACVQQMWRATKIFISHHIARDGRFSAGLRDGLLARGTQAKLATALVPQGKAFALMCADRVGCAHSDWTSCQFDIFATVAGEVLGPILGSIAKLGADDRDHRLSAHGLVSLSKAE